MVSLASPPQRKNEPEVLMKEEEVMFFKNEELQYLYFQLQLSLLMSIT